jgi:hypothetical protein
MIEMLEMLSGRVLNLPNLIKIVENDTSNPNDPPHYELLHSNTRNLVGGIRYSIYSILNQFRPLLI